MVSGSVLSGRLEAFRLVELLQMMGLGPSSGALHLHNIVRSNDLMLGCPADVAGFALLQRMLAARLGLAVGKYTHSISNAHIYDLHFEAARELMRGACDRCATRGPIPKYRPTP